MATLFSNSSGNFTASGTWSLVDSTSYLNSETSTTNGPTTFTNSSSFTPGAITIDGIAVKASAHGVVGTVSVRLVTGGGAAGSTTGSAVAGTTVTINTTDLPTVSTSTQVGWFFMKFASPVTLAAATAYNLQVQTSTSNGVTFYRDGTASNWSRALRTTTTQAPAATDELLVGGDYLSAGSNNIYTVTMDNTTSATTFGAIECASKGILNWGTSASTNYYLKILGNLSIYTGGEYYQGTSGTPIPSTSTAKLEFANTSNVQFGVEARIGSIFKTGGAIITNSALLAADASASATSLTTNISTGWLSGDSIGIASTTRTRTEVEKKSLTANAVGTTLTIAALTNAHSGSSPTQAELINLTRNCQIFGTSTSFQAYINIASTAMADIQSTEIYQMGSATTNKRGIDVGTTTGSCTINNCSIHDFVVTSSIGTTITSAASNNYNVTNNVYYGIALSGINQVATSGTSYTINNNIVMAFGQAATSTGIILGDLRGTITNLISTSGQGVGISLADNNATASNIFGTISGLTAHSNSTAGISIVNTTGTTNNPMATLLSLSSWRNGTNGISLSNSFALMIDTVTAFGNATANISLGATICTNIYFENMIINSGSTLTCPIGFNITTDLNDIYIDNSTFGSTTAHSTADINVNSTNLGPRVITRNTTLSSTTQVGTPTNMTEGSYIGLAKLNTIAGNHKTFKKYGTIQADTTIFNSGPTSTRLTPNNALSNNKLQSAVKKVAVPSGQTATIKLFLRKSVIGDGAAYSGNQPRLILRADPATGITTDTVLATADNTYNGVFKELSATTPAITDNAVFQVYIDCDGTAGWVNCDDWSVS